MCTTNLIKIILNLAILNLHGLMVHKSQQMFGLFLAYTSTIFLLNIMLLAMIKHVLIMQIMMTIYNFLVYSFA